MDAACRTCGKVMPVDQMFQSKNQPKYYFYCDEACTKHEVTVSKEHCINQAAKEEPGPKVTWVLRLREWPAARIIAVADDKSLLVKRRDAILDAIRRYETDFAVYAVKAKAKIVEFAVSIGRTLAQAQIMADYYYRFQEGQLGGMEIYFGLEDHRKDIPAINAPALPRLNHFEELRLAQWHFGRITAESFELIQTEYLMEV